jgi:hypothetical protein
MEQMMACLLSMIQNNPDNLKEIRASQELLKGEILTKSDAHRERMMARMDSQLEKVEACLVKMEASPEEIEIKVEHEEVPKEEATVETFGALKEQYKDWHLAGRCRDQPKKWIQGNGGSWRKLATACRGMTCLAGVIRPSGTRQGQCCRRNLERRISGKRFQTQSECNSGIRNQDLKEQLSWEAREMFTRPSGRPRDWRS